MAEPTILVTGAAGFVGRHLVRHLLSCGEERVGLLVRSRARLERALPDHQGRLALFEGDLTRPLTLKPALEGVTLVYNCAAWLPTHGQEQAQAHKVNVEGTRNLADAARAAGVRRIVHVSSTAVMGAPRESPIDETSECRPSSAYERTKLEAERILREAHGNEEGPEIVILRPPMIAGREQTGGPLLRLFRLARKNAFPVFGDRLDVEKPIVDVADLVRALHLAAERPEARGVYLVTAGGGHTLRQFLAIAAELTGSRRGYRRIPMAVARAGSRLTTPLARAAGVAPPLSPERLDMLLADRPIVIDKARRELGYEPQVTDLRDMLTRTYEGFVASGQLRP